MRIVVDMQGAQTKSRYRGIGRYTLSFAKALARNREKHDIILALSSLFPGTIEPIRAAFHGLLPQENIRVWYAPGPIMESQPGNDTRRKVAELLREAFFASLAPDVIHISSLFEGYEDDAVTSIGRFDRDTPVSVSYYDLIPLLNPDHYLKPNPTYARYYERKIGHLRQANIYLAISEFSKREGMVQLNVPESCFINVSTAIESHFKNIKIDKNNSSLICHKFGLTSPFILYTGGADKRKNLPRLIQAYAILPEPLREKHQILLAGKMPEAAIAELKRQAESSGLKPGDLRFTGYVTDEELIQLYNMCKVYVFPSWHEGFGLPALEAMACGAPVIGANSTSLPEVIGSDTALFDPLNVSSIADKMVQALNDDNFRTTLREHGLQQANRFSWDESAKLAITAWTNLSTSLSHHVSVTHRINRRPKLAFVSPLPPIRSGIADYSAELLPVLAEHYDIDVVVTQNHVDDGWNTCNCMVRDVSWFIAHADNYDRVLYQIGNSPFHQYMLPTIRKIPGIIVLHDFYISELMAWLELHFGEAHAWTESLYASHGYSAVAERYRDAETAKRKYPVNLNILQHACGLITHSEYSRKLAQRWYGEGCADNWEVIPLLRSPGDFSENVAARKKLGIDEDDFVVCSFGYLNATKLNHRLLNAWLNSAMVMDKRCRLFFVGENHGGDYGATLLKDIRKCKQGDRICITGFVSHDRYRQYLLAADVAVQLRTDSRGETSAAVLDCMNHALPLIVNANGSNAELDREAVWMLADEFDESELIVALETLLREPERGRTLGERAREIIKTRHAPPECARRYAEAIERFYHRAETSTPALLSGIAANKQFVPNNAEFLHLSKAIARNLPLLQHQKRLFLDVSATCRNDLRTGIERVARSLMLRMLDTPPAGYRIEPVYLSVDNGKYNYRYARRYTLGLLGCPSDVLEDEIVEPESGDVVLRLDLSGDLLFQAESAGLFVDYRDLGVFVYSVVFDLLPVRMPDVFPPGSSSIHEQWLQTISKLEGAICISKAVADDLFVWQAEAGIEWKNRRPFQIGWFHLGADIANSAPTLGLPDNAEWVLSQLRARQSFLMVGTIEPRKAYRQTIDAFNRLWNDGINVNLIIVGKEGWTDLPDSMRRDIPKTIDQLRTHPERNNRLFWLEGVTDEFLEKIYTVSTCLIAASYGEGYGLPLIEAAQHKLPIIARDIPVFREVAGGYAFYFSASNGNELARAICDWLEKWPSKCASGLETINFMNWKQSTIKLIDVLIGGNWQYRQVSAEVRKESNEQAL